MGSPFNIRAQKQNEPSPSLPYAVVNMELEFGYRAFSSL